MTVTRPERDLARLREDFEAYLAKVAAEVRK